MDTGPDKATMQLGRLLPLWAAVRLCWGVVVSTPTGVISPESIFALPLNSSSFTSQYLAVLLLSRFVYTPHPSFRFLIVLTMACKSALVGRAVRRGKGVDMSEVWCVLRG